MRARTRLAIATDAEPLVSEPGYDCGRECAGAGDPAPKCDVRGERSVML